MSSQIQPSLFIPAFVLFSFGAFGLSIACAEALLPQDYYDAVETGSGAGLWSILFSVRVVFLMFSTSSDQIQGTKKKGQVNNSLLYWVRYYSYQIDSYSIP